MSPLFRFTSFASVLAVAGTAQAVTIFDATVDDVYLASGDPGVTLTDTGSGVTVVNGSTSPQNAYVFGNFDDVTLDDIGDSVTLNFTLSDPPPTLPTFRVILSGKRGGLLNTEDVGLRDFSRAYAGYGITQPVGTINVAYYSNEGGPATNPTEDRHLTEQSDFDIASDTTGGGDDRFNSDDTASISLTIARDSATTFNISSTLDVVGGSGEQQLGGFSYAPPVGNRFQLGDAFTTFGIGTGENSNNSDQINPGSSFVISDLSVEFNPVPEPASAVLAGLGGALLLGRRRGGR